MSRLRRIERVIRNNRNNYFIEPCDRYIGWCITKNCTFNCPYCIYSCKNTNNFSSKDELQIACSYLNNISTEKSWVAIYGGEPTTHPLFIDVVSNYKYNVKIYTNLYRDLYYLKELSDSVNLKLRILTSFHPKRTDIIKLVEKISYLLSRDNTSVEVKCMFTGEDDKSSYDTLALLMSEYSNNTNFTVLPRTIYSNIYTSSFSWHSSELFWKARQLIGKDLLFSFEYDNKCELHDKYDLQFGESNIKHYHKYKSLVCEAGDKYISILDSFNIYPCCRYDEDFYDQKPLGNVLTRPFFDFKKTVCSLPFCFPPEEDFFLKRIVIK